MPKSQGMSLRRLSEEAARYAAFYFDPVEQARMRAEEDGERGRDYAVLMLNRYVPIDCVPGLAAVLRRFVRGGATALDTVETEKLRQYWCEIDSSEKMLSAALKSGEAVASVQAAARSRPTWPAVAIAWSETEMRSLLVMQFETIRQNNIPWRCVDSNTHHGQTPRGIYVQIDWFWHG